MLNSSDGLAASDVIRSMVRIGLHREEIYDTLVGIGLPGEQVHLLIDRVQAESEEAKLAPQTSRLAAEVRGVFEETMERTKIELASGLGSLAEKLERLETRVAELKTLVCRRGSGKSRKKD